LENAIGSSQAQEQIRRALAQGAGRGILAEMSNGIAHIATQPGLATTMIDMEAEALRAILA
jgi:electron transfer flavoprotein alpha/beta subunit